MQVFVNRLIDRGITTAIFDLDGTIARTNITHLYFFLRGRQALHPALWALQKGAIYSVWGLPFSILERIHRPSFQRQFYRWYGRFTVEELREEAEAFFRERGLERLIQATGQLLEQCVRAGLKVEIHSTNMELFVAPFARHFGVEYRALPVIPDARFHSNSGDLQRALIVADELTSFKGTLLDALNEEQCLLVADSLWDMPELKRVAAPVIFSENSPRWGKDLNGHWLDAAGVFRKLNER